jgi:hypothetical protein
MSALHCAAIYVAVGAVAAFVLGRGEGTPGARLAAAALAFFAWPLWAPIASFRERPASSGRAAEAEGRIQVALDEALSAVRGTSLAALLTEPSVATMRASVSRSSARIVELEAMVGRSEREASETRARIEQLERAGGSGRALSTARVHLDNLEKLVALFRAERAALEDLADLCEALRSQLVLARFAGPSLDGVSDLVAELGARVEGLDSALAEVVSGPESP